MEALLCKHYGCLPSQLAKEPADAALRNWLVANEYEVALSKRKS